MPPWEKYANTPGPWTKYQQPAQAAVPAATTAAPEARGHAGVELALAPAALR